MPSFTFVITRVAKLLLLLLCLIFTLNSRSESSLLQKARYKFGAIPTQPPELKNNPLTPTKIALGKMLFFDARLSSTGTVSCNSCHDLAKGGVDNRATSPGVNGQQGTRNSPSVFNAIFNIAQFWDGRAKDLQEQAKGPIQNPVEMNNTPAQVVQTLRGIPTYATLFQTAFPHEAEPLTFENLAKAIEAFEATLLTPGSRFDQYLAGDEAVLTEPEKRGLSLFIGKDCASCHKGINLGGVSYHRFGVAKKPAPEILPPHDKGRLTVTNLASDEYVFRAPSLRNVELTAPYFHSGKVWELKEAINVMTNVQLGIKLKEREVDDLVAFLKTLTGKLPTIEAPVLPMER
jgi:cytochrome c peroxidase